MGPSGAGKGIVLQNMIMDIYDKCFERVYIFSPSFHVDQTWLPVKEYLKKTINMKDNEPPLYYDHYDPVSLEMIIDTQRKIVEHQKKQKETKKLFQIMIIVDDFADDPSFSRNSKLLHSLFTRGRHSATLTATTTHSKPYLLRAAGGRRSPRGGAAGSAPPRRRARWARAAPPRPEHSHCSCADAAACAAAALLLLLRCCCCRRRCRR